MASSEMHATCMQHSTAHMWRKCNRYKEWGKQGKTNTYIHMHKKIKIDIEMALSSGICDVV